MEKNEYDFTCLSLHNSVILYMFTPDYIKQTYPLGSKFAL